MNNFVRDTEIFLLLMNAERLAMLYSEKVILRCLIMALGNPFEEGLFWASEF